MIGNDIVDIIETRKTTNWRRPRFLEKLFTRREQHWIKNCEDPFLMVWRLWSMKEAAYKLYIQINPSRFYNPKAFKCDIENLKVRYKHFDCYVKTKITSKYIVSEARLKDDKMTSEAMFFDHNNIEKQSEILKSEILKSISNTYHINKNNLELLKNEFGVPAVEFNLKRINISLTHHGNYGAFAYSNFVASSGVEKVFK